MKYILSIVIAFMLFAGYGLFDAYKKLASVDAMTQALKASNMKLTKKNKALTTQNKKLVAREKHIHKRITERRTKLTKANLHKAQKKLVTAGAKMAPFLGMPVIVGATAYDINDYCASIDEMEQFEYELFGDKALSNYDKTVCGVDVEKQLELTAKGVNNSYKGLLNNFNQNTAYASVFWKQRLQESAKMIENESKQMKIYYAEEYLKLAKYFAEKNNAVVPFGREQVRAIAKYRDTVIDFYSNR